MNELIIHPKTNKILQKSLLKPSHAYLFVGDSGLGKTTTAKDFATALVGSSISEGDIDRWVLLVSPIQSKKISISQMQPIKDFANKTAPRSITNKVVIIDQADNMSIEASNSLLLLLEEPPPSTVIILVADNAQRIPKTILSRLQIIRFYPPTTRQMEDLVNKRNLDSTIISVIGRYPAKIVNSSADNHQQIKDQIEMAESFIRGGIKQRLMIASTISDKAKTNDFLEAMAKLINAPDSDHFSLKRGESLIAAQFHLYNNGNPRFVIEELALEFI